MCLWVAASVTCMELSACVPSEQLAVCAARLCSAGLWVPGPRLPCSLFTLPVQSAETWKAASFLAATFGSPKDDWVLIAWGWGECDLVHCFPELEPVQAAQNKTGKYVPPSLRDGASRRGESMQPNRRGKRRGIA